ncbi:hypothetical protein RO3G_14779 [Rhizopus delemar RA 99-880]|uniref:Uncharacterized protein n=1 Tax=Rhizopus delemar (strain RA 99-880 / ATCC MYA-4621 / FGSC 9543 / NRRL 43880) TaxID=246409 RepID=I1CNN8_RHIO9|nr:hypothetical protein RO3G_14779 [Rhizopus delemar RA 99-880]|eukprot:EIE90068.1 hypothetical protein RO3G_14779 [Rhizopus delemar RA 99-880]
MSDRIIEFNPAPVNARGSNSAGQPIALPSRAVVPEFVSSDGILDSFAYPRPGYPPMTNVQKRMREAEDVGRDEASLSFSIYLDMRKEIDTLKEMLRKEQEEKRALQVAFAKVKEAYSELEQESSKSAKPIATAIKDAVRNHYNDLPPSSKYDLSKPLKSVENQKVLKLLQEYVNSHYAYKHTNGRDLRKYLERQYYTKKAGMAGEEVGVVDEFKIKTRKAMYEQHKDQGVYNNYPNCEYLLQQQYMSEEEDMYNSDTMDKVEEVLLEQNPDRTIPFTEKERMSVLCTKTIDYFEVRVPKYRSPACTEFFKLLDDQIASDRAKRQRTGTSNIQSLPRIRRKCSLPVPDFVRKENITEESIAWAFGSEMQLDEDDFQF